MKVTNGSTFSPSHTALKSYIFSAASRTVNHYLAKDPDSAPMNLPVVPKISKELSARLGGTPPVEGWQLKSWHKYKLKNLGLYKINL